MKEKINQSADLRDKKNTSGRKRKSGSAGLTIIMMLLAVSFIFAGMVFGYYFGYSIFAESGGDGTGAEAEIVIEEGESLGEVAAKLYEAGLIDDKLVFIFQAYFYEYEISPGKYVLNDSMTNEEIFIQLEGGGF